MNYVRLREATLSLCAAWWDIGPCTSVPEYAKAAALLRATSHWTGVTAAVWFPLAIEWKELP